MSNPTSSFGWQMPTPTDLVTDLPADFEVFGQAVDSSMADLLGGTTGQILAKNSNTNMDFVWIANDQGDITGITASSPLTGGGTSGAVTIGILNGTTSNLGAVQLSDSTSSTSTTLAATANAVKTTHDLANAAIPKSLIDAAGDLIVGTADNTAGRLGIGSSGQVLTVSSGAPAWATASTGGMTLISTTTLTGASVTLSAISSSYTNLRVVIRNYKPANDGGSIYFRVNGDAGANRYQLNTWTTANGTKTFGADAWILANNNDNSVATGYLEINFPDYANTVTWKTINGYGYSTDSGTTTSAYYNSFTGAFNQTGAISSMEFINSGGNFTSGTVLLYGVK